MIRLMILANMRTSFMVWRPPPVIHPERLQKDKNQHTDDEKNDQYETQNSGCHGYLPFAARIAFAILHDCATLLT